MDNKEVVREFRKLLDGRDFAAASSLMSADVRWWVPRSSEERFERPVAGRDAVIALLSSATARFYRPETMTREYHAFVAEDDYVAVWFTMAAVTAIGNGYNNDYILLHRCEDGQVAEVWEHLDTAYAKARREI